MSDTNQTTSNQTPRTVTHRDGFEGYTIVENHYRDRNGNLLCDCMINDPEGRFVRRYMKLEDAMQYLRAHLNMQRIRAEGDRQ